MPNPLRERNSRVNCLLEELARGNSRLQLVDIDTGFVQVVNRALRMERS